MGIVKKPCICSGFSNLFEKVEKKLRDFIDRRGEKCYNSVTICKDLQKGCDAIVAAARKTEGLVYRGRPLRRVGNMIYYGSMADKYIIQMQVRETKKVQDLDVATKVSVELQLTAPNLRSRDRVVKKGEKDSLYAAMDFGSVWLERALSGK